MDATADSGSGFGFGMNQTQHSPEPDAVSSGWGQSNNNEPEQPTNETSGGGGWSWGDTNHGWGAGETNNTSSGWGGGDGSGGWGGGWGSSGDVSGSGGGGWGSSSKNNDVADTTQPTAQNEATNTNPPIPTSSDNAWGSSGTTWGASLDSSNNTWGSSDNTWGSSGWGSSNNTWTASTETAQNEPTSDTGPDKAKGKEWGSGVQTGGWSGWRDVPISETTTGLHSSGGGWGNSTPSVPAVIGVIQGTNFNLIYHVSSFSIAIVLRTERLRELLCGFSFPDRTHATARLDTSPATMDVDEGEPQFEGKAIFNALENVVNRRRNKRKRSHEDIRQSQRYYRHLLASGRTAGPAVDGDGDTVMSGATIQPGPEGFLEPGTFPCVDYDMKVLSREPKTSEEKTTFAKHLL